MKKSTSGMLINPGTRLYIYSPCWCEEQVYSNNHSYLLLILATVVTLHSATRSIDNRLRRHPIGHLHLPAAALVPVRPWGHPAAEGEVGDLTTFLGRQTGGKFREKAVVYKRQRFDLLFAAMPEKLLDLIMDVVVYDRLKARLLETI